MMFGTHAWNLCMETICVWNTCLEFMLGISNFFWKNPIRNVVGWYRMSFMVYFELVLVWKEFFW